MRHHHTARCPVDAQVLSAVFVSYALFWVVLHADKDLKFVASCVYLVLFLYHLALAGFMRDAPVPLMQIVDGLKAAVSLACAFYAFKLMERSPAVEPLNSKPDADSKPGPNVGPDHDALPDPAVLPPPSAATGATAVAEQAFTGLVSGLGSSATTIGEVGSSLLDAISTPFTSKPEGSTSKPGGSKSGAAEMI